MTTIKVTPTHGAPNAVHFPTPLKPKVSPSIKFSLRRLLALGFTPTEAQKILKG